MSTVREIAEFAGVSKSTVSLVLNNKPGVSEEMRKLVLNAVAELDARQADEHATANETPSAYAETLSLMVLHPPVLRSSYVFSEVLRGIQAAAEMYQAQLRLVVNDPMATTQHVSYLYLSDDALRPDGVLVFGAQRTEPLLEKAVQLGIPGVVLGRDARKYHVSGIERDERRHAYEAAQHLLELGHRAIAFVGGSTDYDYPQTRLQGYRQALYDTGIQAQESWVCLGDGAQATESVLRHAPEISAIIYVNDSYAAEGLPVLAAQGRHIPDDVAVISFDDTPIARDYDPPLTSISYNRFKEGQWAVKMLLDQIRYPFLERIQIMFGGELIVRESTLPQG